MIRKNKDTPVRLYPKKEKKINLDFKVTGFFIILFIITFIAIVLAMSCKSYYYVSLV